MRYRKLFTPIKIGDMEARNRIVLLAIGTKYTGEDGFWEERYENFLEERARGGAGIVMASFSPSYVSHALLPGLYDDVFIKPLSKLSEKIKKHGARFIIQLVVEEWSPGKGKEPEHVSPSGIPKRKGLEPPRALSKEEIKRIIYEFGEAGRRVREAGCDGIEIHAGMGFLINQFLSPATNKREDEYGGDYEGRMRFLKEIIEEVKRKSQGLPLFVRFSAEEFVEGGLGLDNTRKIARDLEKMGVSCLNVQAGWHESPKPLVQGSVPEGAFIYLAEEIKKVVSIPVIGAYRIRRPEMADDILVKGKADLVGMARALIADPEFPKKAMEGREEEIRPCIACCRCLDRVLQGKELSCSVNPYLGKKPEFKEGKKKVFVIGGGPAGITAAITASRRGHDVTLFEKEKLGGQLNYASIAPHKSEVGEFKEYLLGELKRSGVKVKIGETPKEKPDVAIIATGAKPLIPKIPGVERAITAIEALSGKEVGDDVLIIGGGMVGCEVAEYMADKGKKVTIFEMLPRIGADIGPVTRWVILDRLRRKGVKMETNAKVIEIKEKGVKIERNGKEEEFHGDTIILAAGMEPSPYHMEAPEVYIIGDAKNPRRIKEAIEEGAKVGGEV